MVWEAVLCLQPGLCGPASVAAGRGALQALVRTRLESTCFAHCGAEAESKMVVRARVCVRGGGWGRWGGRAGKCPSSAPRCVHSGMNADLRSPCVAGNERVLMLCRLPDRRPFPSAHT
jgi:hypothetical protein